MPASLSSLITVPSRALSAAVSAGSGQSRAYLREWLLQVPDPRKRAGRWHPLEFVLAVAMCAFTAAGHDFPSAVAEWAACCSRATLLLLGGRPDPLTRRVWPPSARTLGRVLAAIDADALKQALYGYLAAMPAATAEKLPEVTRREREQRRAGRARTAAAGRRRRQGRPRRRPPRRQQGPSPVRFPRYGTADDGQREIDAKANEVLVLARYAAHYNGWRPHRSRQLRPPLPDHPVAGLSRERIKRRPILGGLISEYERAT
jgi:hypothetical protein